MATYKASLMLHSVTGGTRTNPSLALKTIPTSLAIKVPLSASNPSFVFLNEVEAGQRNLPVFEHTTIRGIEAKTTQRILTGRGAMPLTETQTTTETKPIRRWPRDWHGANM